VIRSSAFACLLLAGCVPVSTATPSNPQALQDADRLFLQGDYARAAALYEQVAAENPGDPERASIHLRAGRCHLGAGRPDMALGLFDQAQAAGPDAALRWEILFRRGIAHRMRGDAPRAVECHRQVLAAPPVERGRSVIADELHYELALALFRAGDWKAGQAQLAVVGANGPFSLAAEVRKGLSAWTVQVAAFSDEARARDSAGRINATVRPIAVDKPHYVVTTGTFARYDDAVREAERLRKLGHADALVLP
jgi:tetratricopeptide (TPR) repeat protein